MRKVVGNKAECQDLIFDIEGEEVTSKSNKSVRGKKTLLSSMKDLYVSSKESTLDSEYLKDESKTIKYIQKYFPVSPTQAVLLAVGVAEYESGSVDMNDWMNHFSVTSFETMLIRKELCDLVVKGILKPLANRGGRLFAYALPEEVMESIRGERKYVEKSYNCSGPIEFFGEIDIILSTAFSAGAEDRLALDIINAQVEMLMVNNPDLEFVKGYRTLGINALFDRITFLYWAMSYVLRRERDIDLTSSPLGRIATTQQKSRIVSTLKYGTNILITKSILEPVSGVDANEYRLTEKTLNKLFCDFESTNGTGKNRMSKGTVIQPDSIVKRELFFNETELSQINKVRQILDQKKYNDITQRLEQVGLRKGVCILLSGTPGVGKTEFVMQLARESGRPVMKISASDIKDKYIGESEKKLTRIFNEYDRLCKEKSVAPILFLNECDQLLLRRVSITDTSSGGDKVDNTISSMFLEQMESLQGIMICTTNCVQNLDNAFERRFLFKIVLNKPDAKTRYSIWKSNFPNISDKDIETLSEDFDFSGGQIENITRKALIDQAISDTELTLESLKDYCSHELFKTDSMVKPVSGFTCY